VAIRTDLITEIRTLIGRLPTNLTSRSAIDNLYEVYLFTLVLKAARGEGAIIRIKDQSTNSPRSLYFRTSPGYITSQVRNYSFAEIEFAGKPLLEAHVSIRVSGKSNVLHECDVCVLQKSEADLCRGSSDRLAPRSSKIILNIEAKFYTSSLTLNLGRSFLGLTSDLSSHRSFFVTNSSSDSIEKLLSHKNKPWDNNIKPGSINELNRLIYTMQNSFKEFKAKQ